MKMVKRTGSLETLMNRGLSRGKKMGKGRQIQS